MLTLYLSLIDTQEERDKFERLFHQYERCLKYTAQNILFDEHLAEDAVQETFIRIISCLDKIDESDEHKTIAFLITVIKNISYDMKRKRNKTQEESSLEEMMELDSDPEDEENRPDVLLLRREQEETILQSDPLPASRLPLRAYFKICPWLQHRPTGGPAQLLGEARARQAFPRTQKPDDPDGTGVGKV